MTDLPRQVFAVIIALVREGIEFTHVYDGNTRHVDARGNGHQLLVNFTPTGRATATLDGNYLNGHHIAHAAQQLKEKP